MPSISYSTGAPHSGPTGPSVCGRAVIESTRRHEHADFQVGVFLEGAGSLYCRGARHTLAPHSLVVVPPGEAHSGHSTQETGWSYRVLTVPAALLREISADVDHHGTPREPQFDTVVLPDAQLFSAFRLLCGAFRWEAQLLEREELVTQVFGDLLLRHGTARISRPVLGREPRAVREAIAYMEEHSARNFSLDELAKVACLSKYHFTRVFKKEVGLTPHAYQIHLRVRRAAQMIRCGMGISSAAHAAGFAAQSHLNLHFKRCLGITPGHYARSAA